MVSSSREAAPAGLRLTTGGVSLSGSIQLMARHSRSSSQRTHSFIFFRLEMTVPKHSFMMRGKATSDARQMIGGTAVATDGCFIIYGPRRSCQPERTIEMPSPLVYTPRAFPLP